MSASGGVRQNHWHNYLQRYWSNKLPVELESALFKQRNFQSFLTNLIYQPLAQHHPIKHMIVIGQLFGGVDEFLRCYNDDLFQYESTIFLSEETVHRVPQYKIVRLLNELNKGGSLRQSAKKSGVSTGFAKSTALQHGIEIERRTQWLFSSERKQVLDWLKEGRKTQDIANLMGCSVGSIEQLLTQYPAIKSCAKN